MKREQWGSQLVQEKYQEEKACDKRHPYCIIIIIEEEELEQSVTTVFHVSYNVYYATECFSFTQKPSSVIIKVLAETVLTYIMIKFHIICKVSFCKYFDND